MKSANIREMAAEGLRVGDVFSLSRTYDARDVAPYADISGDFNPVHFDDRFARVKNFAACICHGLLVISPLTEIGGQIGWLASGMDLKFKKPVYSGDTVECVFTITELDERDNAKAEVAFTNQKGQVVAEAMLTGRVPGERERQIMKAMLAEGDPTNRLSRQIRARRNSPACAGSHCFGNTR